MCGFSNAITFKDIDDEDIDSVEKFVKSDLIQYFTPHQQSTPKMKEDDIESCIESELSEDDKQSFFGVYSSNPSKFVFLRGERKMLSALVDHVKSITAGPEGSKHFQLNEDGIDKIKITWKGSFTSKLGMHFGDGKRNSRQKKVVSKKSSVDLKHDLYEKLQVFMQTNYNVLVPNLAPNQVDVKIAPNNVISAKIHCVVCLAQKKAKMISIYCRNTEGNPYWVFSNLQRHIDGHFKKSDLDTDRVDGIATMSGLAENENLEEEEELGTGSQSDAGKRSRIVDSMFTQLTVQMIKMKNTVSVHKEPKEKFDFQLKDDALATIHVTAIKKDGNCLFSALAHQIFHVKLNSSEHEKATMDLRQESVNYIKGNFHEFAHDIRGRVLDKMPSTKTQDIEKECTFFINQCLTRAGCWGGFESIKAISKLHKINILIFCENGAYYFANRFDAGYNASVCLAFRDANRLKKKNAGTVKNHYDSVVDIDTHTLSECSEYCAKISHKTECNINSDSIISLEDSFASQQ